jgi:hypothetical protein
VFCGLGRRVEIGERGVEGTRKQKREIGAGLDRALELAKGVALDVSPAPRTPAIQFVGKTEAIGNRGKQQPGGFQNPVHLPGDLLGIFHVLEDVIRHHQVDGAGSKWKLWAGPQQIENAPSGHAAPGYSAIRDPLIQSQDARPAVFVREAATAASQIQDAGRFIEIL